MAKEARKARRPKGSKKIEPSWAKTFMRQKAGLIDPKKVKKGPRSGPGRVTMSSRRRWVSEHVFGDKPPPSERDNEERSNSEDDQQEESPAPPPQTEPTQEQKNLDEQKPSPVQDPFPAPGPCTPKLCALRPCTIWTSGSEPVPPCTTPTH